MTQSDKELLLRDLSARLQYKLHCRVFKLNGDIKENNDILYGVIGDNIVTLKSDEDECLMYYQIKPYLRPMSSMTEEEKETYQMFFNEDGLLNTSIDTYLDWLLEGHFDFRGLIQMGLALEAPEDMYKID